MVTDPKDKGMDNSYCMREKATFIRSLDKRLYQL